MNLKKKTFAGKESHGMLLCAKNAAEDTEILEPPADCQAGDFVTFEGHGREPKPVLDEVTLKNEDGTN